MFGFGGEMGEFGRERIVRRGGGGVYARWIAESGGQTQSADAIETAGEHGAAGEKMFVPREKAGFRGLGQQMLPEITAVEPGFLHWYLLVAGNLALELRDVDGAEFVGQIGV